MSHCAPGANKSDFTCFSINALRKIASAYNQQHARNSKDTIKFSSNTTKNQLWTHIRKKLSNQCQTEWCWLDLDFVKSLNDPELRGGSHRPKGPTSGKYDWLKTTDINKAMKQYEGVNPGFVFFGPVPIDFAEINTELNKMNLGSLINKGIKSVGIVFNMDPHDQGGSHWVAMYIDLKKWVISYFDSFGICPPPAQITRLIHNLNKSAMQIKGKKMFINCNTNQHQMKNTECGVYSMYFIVESLKGRSFNDITKKIILDDDINKYRDLFFRPIGKPKKAQTGGYYY